MEVDGNEQAYIETFHQHIQQAYAMAIESDYRFQHVYQHKGIDDWLDDHGEEIFGDNLRILDQVIIRIRSYWSPNARGGHLFVLPNLEARTWKEFLEAVKGSDVVSIEGKSIVTTSYPVNNVMHRRFIAINGPEYYLLMDGVHIQIPPNFVPHKENIMRMFVKVMTKRMCQMLTKHLLGVKKGREVKELFKKLEKVIQGIIKSSIRKTNVKWTKGVIRTFKWSEIIKMFKSEMPSFLSSLDNSDYQSRFVGNTIQHYGNEIAQWVREFRSVDQEMEELNLSHDEKEVHIMSKLGKLFGEKRMNTLEVFRGLQEGNKINYGIGSNAAIPVLHKKRRLKKRFKEPSTPKAPVNPWKEVFNDNRTVDDIMCEIEDEEDDIPILTVGSSMMEPMTTMDTKLSMYDDDESIPAIQTNIGNEEEEEGEENVPLVRTSIGKIDRMMDDEDVEKLHRMVNDDDDDDDDDDVPLVRTSIGKLDRMDDDSDNDSDSDGIPLLQTNIGSIGKLDRMDDDSDSDGIPLLQTNIGSIGKLDRMDDDSDSDGIPLLQTNIGSIDGGGMIDKDEEAQRLFHQKMQTDPKFKRIITSLKGKFKERPCGNDAIQTVIIASKDSLFSSKKHYYPLNPLSKFSLGGKSSIKTKSGKTTCVIDGNSIKIGSAAQTSFHGYKHEGIPTIMFFVEK
ncbi:MAG: hypothetical protein ACTSUE_10500 [Promethearchaeota archaeon]